jgi:general secretion pathway protein K
MLVVMVAVALVTAVAMDLAYQARVNLQIAAAGRDELRAQALAKGSINLSRLVLHFQMQVDGAASAAASTASNLGPAAGLLPPALAAGAAGLTSMLSGMPRLQLWKLVPVDSTLVGNLFPDSHRAARPGGAGEVAGAGGEAPEGRFQAQIDDEDRKVNVQLDALAQGGLLGAQVASLGALLADRKWDPLFEREDANGVKVTRAELAAHLTDWVDDDTVQSTLTGLTDRPFERGFGDENYLYDRGPERYKAKNARFDSLDELFLVAGFSDLHMAAFGDRLTVYPARNSQMNVNADDPAELVRNARIMADPPNQPIFSDLTFAERLQRAVNQVRLGGFVTMTPQQFASVLESLGVGVGTDYIAGKGDKRGAFTDRSLVFRVRGRGAAGRVEKTIEAVVTFEQGQAREDATGLGRLIHWREE